MSRPRLTLVLPARDEAAVIRRTVTEVSAYLQRLEPSHEILVGDSGSRDGTGDIARATGAPHVRVIRDDLPGKGRILTRCLAAARGEVVGFLDADLEIPVHTVGRLLERIRAGADVAIAIKTPRTDTGRPAPRRLGTRVFNRMVAGLFGSPLADHQAGCKLFRAHLLRRHLEAQTSTGWLWDTEMLVRLLRDGARVVEVPCEPRPIRPSRLSARDVLLSMAQLGRLWIRLRAGGSVGTSADAETRRVVATGIHA